MNRPSPEPSLSHALDANVQENILEVSRELKQLRKRQRLTQAQLGDKMGMRRTTVGKAESAPASTHLETVARMAHVLGTRLVVERPDPVQSKELKHQGLAYVRTQHNQEYHDAQREKAFALAWLKENAADEPTKIQLMAHLVPGCTQEQATAAATVVQWLGSEVGFAFLHEVLNSAGFALSARST